MTANVDAMIRAGTEAYRAGNKAEARALLERAIELDSYNEMAWLWLSAVVDTSEEQQTCLENVLMINPNSDRARQGLRQLGIDPDTIAPTQTAPAPAFTADVLEDASLFGDTDFSVDSNFEFDDNLFEDPVYEDEVIDDTYDAVGDTYDIVDDGDDLFADRMTLDDFESDLNSSMTSDTYNPSEFDRDPLAPKPSKSSIASYDDEEPVEADPMDAFKLIPSEIKPQRAPGEDEPAPTLDYALIGILALVNIGAIGFIAMQFLG